MAWVSLLIALTLSSHFQPLLHRDEREVLIDVMDRLPQIAPDYSAEWGVLSRFLGEQHEWIDEFARSTGVISGPVPSGSQLLKSRMNDAEKVSNALQHASLIADSFADDMSELQLCVFANMSMTGCDVNAEMDKLIAKLHQHVAMPAANVGHGSRPTAPRYAGNPDRLGDGNDSTSKRFFFWCTAAAFFLTQFLEAESMVRPVKWMTQVREKWDIIFQITPTFEEWKHALSYHDDIDLLLKELCDIDGENLKSPFFKPGDDIDPKSIDMHQVWASPELDNKQQITWPSIVAKLNNLKDLPKCWQQQAQLRTLNKYFTFGSIAGRLMVVALGMMILMLPDHGSTVCDSQMASTQEIATKGKIFCSNGNLIGSICILTCPAGFITSQQSTESTGQVVVCSSTGGWLGKYNVCASADQAIDWTYR